MPDVHLIDGTTVQYDPDPYQASEMSISPPGSNTPTPTFQYVGRRRLMDSGNHFMAPMSPMVNGLVTIQRVDLLLLLTQIGADDAILEQIMGGPFKTREQKIDALNLLLEKLPSIPGIIRLPPSMRLGVQATNSYHFRDHTSSTVGR